MMLCPNCGAEYPEGAKFCGSCGAPLESAEEYVDEYESLSVSVAECPHCGAKNDAEFLFCLSCGELMEQDTIPAQLHQKNWRYRLKLIGISAGIIAGAAAIILLVAWLR